MSPETSPSLARSKTANQFEGAVGVWEWDIRADTLRGDVRFAQLNGLDAAEARAGLPTSTFFSAVDPEHRMRVRIAVAGVLHGAEVFTRDYRVIAPDGTRRWVAARGGLGLDAAGAPACFHGVLTDITDQKRIEEQLRVAQTAGGVGSFEYVAGFGTADVSSQFCRLLGLHDADVLPIRTVNSVVFPEDPAIIASPDADEAAQTAYTEFRIHRADTGETRWLARRGEMTVDTEGFGRRFVGVVYDVTTAKTAEAQLRTLADTLAERVEARTQERDRLWSLSRDLFMVSGVDGVCRAANPAWTEVMGYAPDALTGRRIVELIHPDDLEQTRIDAAGLVHGEAVKDLDCRVRGADGDYRWINWSAAVRDGEIFATGRDVSQRKLLEEQLRQSQKMEAVGQLTGGLAHDFNNMLTGIMGALDIVKRRINEGRTDDLARFMTAATTSAERAAGLTHRLLAFSRRQSLDTRALDANVLVRSLEDLLSRTLGERVRLNLALAEAPALVWSDANQLESAILNLALNARDAMADGGDLTVETASETLTVPLEGQPDAIPPGRYVRISVRDTGSGMTPDVLQKAFEPFFTTKPIGQGTGLGLSMIYGFVRQSGGHLSIRSVVGRGTEISLYLPAATAVADAAPAPGSDNPTPMGDGETILVVEDDPSVRLLVLDVLQELGYAGLEAENAEAGLAILRTTSIDLLITDVGLPGMNGRQLAELAQSLKPGLRVLFMTGYAEQAADRASFLGADMAMVTKPFAIDALALKIREMMAQRAGA